MFFETYETQKNTLWYARQTSLDGSRGVSCLLIGASVDQSSGVFHLAPERTCHMQLNALLRQTRISTSKNIYLNFKPLGEHTHRVLGHTTVAWAGERNGGVAIIRNIFGLQIQIMPGRMMELMRESCWKVGIFALLMHDGGPRSCR